MTEEAPGQLADGEVEIVEPTPDTDEERTYRVRDGENVYTYTQSEIEQPTDIGACKYLARSASGYLNDAQASSHKAIGEVKETVKAHVIIAGLNLIANSLQRTSGKFVGAKGILDGAAGQTDKAAKHTDYLGLETASRNPNVQAVPGQIAEIQGDFDELFGFMQGQHAELNGFIERVVALKEDMEAWQARTGSFSETTGDAFVHKFHDPSQRLYQYQARL